MPESNGICFCCVYVTTGVSIPPFFFLFLLRPLNEFRDDRSSYYFNLFPTVGYLNFFFEIFLLAQLFPTFPPPRDATSSLKRGERFKICSTSLTENFIIRHVFFFPSKKLKKKKNGNSLHIDDVPFYFHQSFSAVIVNTYRKKTLDNNMHRHSLFLLLHKKKKIFFCLRKRIGMKWSHLHHNFRIHWTEI